jgi:hypothetical protein
MPTLCKSAKDGPPAIAAFGQPDLPHAALSELADETSID